MDGKLSRKKQLIMTYKNIVLEDLGIVPQYLNGHLDLPKRDGESYYDWGKYQEPLVSADDIYFGFRTIELTAIFDGRKNIDFNTTMTTLRNITTEETLSTPYGDYLVKLDVIDITKNYTQNTKMLKIIFQEQNPNLTSALPLTPSAAGVRIDGFDLFSSFGILVESVNLPTVSQLNISSDTMYHDKTLSIYRKPAKMEIKVNGIYASEIEMSDKIQALNAILAKEGIRSFVYNGIQYQCLVTDGHKVKRTKNRVEIKLKLEIMLLYNLDEITQAVIDQIEIQARPQADLNETDDTKASYVLGVSTFKAADAAKLDGQLPAFYAKQTEIDAVNAKDFAAELETQIQF